MTDKTNRRDFLKTAALTGAGFWVAGRTAWAQSGSPNEKLNIACIGCGGKGKSDVSSVSHENIVALCDVDDERAAETYKAHPNVKKYRDFRKMLEEMDKQIDAVTVSTPDHQHAIAAMTAMKMGKHVFCQKPLTHDVYEARALTEAAAKYKVCTQMGNQGTAASGLREAVEVIQSGAIGPVREAHIWTNRPVWPQGIRAILSLSGVQHALYEDQESIARLNDELGAKRARRRSSDRNRAGAPAAAEGTVRKTLDWDLWLGTAPERRYYPNYLPFNWRGWWDFGCGALGDMACHTANMAFMACKLGYPTSVEAECSEYNPETFPMWSVVRYEFPERDGGKLPPLKWTWYDGGSDKPAWVNRKLKELAHGKDIPGSGSLLIGDKGVLFSPNDYGSQYTLLPEADFAGYKPPTPTLPRLPKGETHATEWLKACKEGKPSIAMSNFSYAGPLTETVVLGCVALRVPGRKIEWDGPSLKITNLPEANQYIKREYRKGWEV
jgi:predicted dehydrogenase